MMLYITIGLFLSLVVSGLCAVAEAAFYSFPHSAIEGLRREGHWTARYLELIKGDMERTIAALLILDTVADTLGVWFVTKAIEGHVSAWAEVAVIASLAVLILVFGEIVPKTLGVQRARSAAPWLAAPFHYAFKALEYTGLVWLSLRLTRRFARAQDSEFDTDDIRGMAELGVKEGALDHQQAEVIRNMLALKKVTARKLMTPRQVAFTLPAKATVLSSIREHGHWPHSRVPVHSEKRDQWIGVVMQRDAYRALAEGKGDMPLSRLQHPLEFVPDSIRADQLLRKFLRQRKHMLGVVDEYGTVAGIVTLEDVMEGILGSEIVDEFDRAVDLQEHARRQSIALAAISLQQQKPN